jgi:uncharacterized protein YjbJ (UPF0337 family)
MALTIKPPLIIWEQSNGLESVDGNWKQTKGKIKEKWGKLTDDDLTQVNGKREFEGKLQERYGVAKDRVRQDVDGLNSLG